MTLFYCCKLRTFVVWISATFFVFQALLLAGTLWLAVSDVGEKVGATVDWLERRALEADDHSSATQFRDARAEIVRVSRCTVHKSRLDNFRSKVESLPDNEKYSKMAKIHTNLIITSHTLNAICKVVPP